MLSEHKRGWYSGGGEKSAKASWKSSCWDSSGQGGMKVFMRTGVKKQRWAAARFGQHLNSSAWPGSCLRSIPVLTYSTNFSSCMCLERFTLCDLSSPICLANSWSWLGSVFTVAFSDHLSFKTCWALYYYLMAHQNFIYFMPAV